MTIQKEGFGLITIPSNDWGNLDSPWLSVNMDIWKTLIKDRPRIKYQAGQDIFWQDKQHANVYIVAKGRVCVSILHSSGQEKHLYIACTGAMIGEVACILSQAHVSTATAITDTELYSIPSREVQRLFHSEAYLADWLLQYEARKNRLLISQITMLAFEKAPQRIARILLCLNENYGQQTPDGIYLNIRFTCAELAAIANTSRVTSNNTMLDFIHEGILAKKKSHYVILDIEKLREIAVHTGED